MKKNTSSHLITWMFSGFLFFLLSCGTQKEVADDALPLRIDGSSTVYPITERIVEDYKSRFNNFAISIGVSGTGGGFDKFVKNELAINNASRRIKQKEKVACDSNGISFRQYEVAYDGIAVVVNKENDWVEDLSVEELRLIWTGNGEMKWSEVRPNWPNDIIKRFGPGAASGTHDYFQDAVLGQDAMTSSFIMSENDNLLAKGVSSERNAIGFFGLAYFKEYSKDLKLIAVDNGGGPIYPSDETVINGTYAPLARPMFIYVNEEFCKTEDGRAFVKFYLSNAAAAAESVGYVALPSTAYELSIAGL